MEINFIDVKKQYNKMKSEIDSAVLSVMSKGQFIMGQDVFDLEYNLSNYTESEYSISCSSGTDALLLALMSLNIRPGDEIITTPFTFISTVEVILLLKAKPVFVDIRKDTFNIDEELIERAITKKTKAIIPVSLFGQTSDMESVNSIAKKYSLKVIEDAAQSFGGSIRDKKVGVFGDVAATSFYPAKPLGCYGDGGAIFTNDDDLAEECKAIRIHGTKKDKYNSEMIGLNGRLDSIQAAVLLEKLSIFDEELEMRNEVNFHYRKFLNNAQYHPEDYQSAHALFSIVLGSDIKRDKLINRLSQNKIPLVIYYKFPIHLMKAFKYLGYQSGSLTISENLSNSIISLPMHPYLSKSDLDLIIETIQKK